MKTFIKNHPFLSDRIVIVFVCVFLFVPFLGSTVLWDMDEAYFGSIAQEMQQKGEWIIPTFNGGAELGDKPILLFWLMRISFLILGVSEFAARFPSVLWSIGTTLLVYQIGLRLFNRSIARIAGFVIVTMLMFCLESRAATTDAALMFLFTAAIYTYIAGIYKKRTLRELETDTIAPSLKEPGQYFPQSIRTVILLYGILGVSVLCKGPVFFILTTAIIGLFFLIKSATKPTFFSVVNPIHFLRTCGKMHLIIAVIMVLIIAGPWYLAVGVKTDWKWWEMFFYKHHFARATSTMHNARGPIFYYLIVFLFDTFPWSVFMGPVCIDMFRRMRGHVSNVGAINSSASNATETRVRTPYFDGLMLTLCWSGVIVVTFSLIATKFPSYIAPMFPAAALIYANFWHYWSKNEELCARFWTPVVLFVLGMVGVLMFVAFQFLIPTFLPGVFQNIEMISCVGLLLFAFATYGFSLLSVSKRNSLRKTLTLLFVLYIMSFFFFGAPLVSTNQRYRELFNAVKAETANNEMPPIGAVNCFAYSWVYYSGGPIKQIPQDAINKFFSDTNNKGVILMPEADYEKMQQESPDDSLHVIKTVQFFARKFKVVAIAKQLNIASPLTSGELNEEPKE
ncbi:MAG: ArnT family glycosyltransferase [Thermoguttaceae bacterium]